MTTTGTRGPDLAAAVTGADPALLLPPRRAGEESRLVQPLRLVDALELPSVEPGAGSRAWVAVVADAAGTMLSVPMVADGSVPGAVRRARAGDRAAEALLALLAAGTDVGSFEVVALHPLTAHGESPVDADQTHDSVAVGRGSVDAVVVKWAVHVEAVATTPPSVAALRHLDAVGFASTPTPVGFLLHRSDHGQLLLASVARFLPGALDGWDWYVDDLLAHLEGTLDAPAVLRPAGALGGLVARLHAAFATAWAGCPEPVTRATRSDAQRWLRRALATVDEAEQVTGGDAGERFRLLAPTARALVRDGLSAAPGTTTSRVHGDLHVGQVLRWDGGYAVSDFDGNPVLPAAERDLPQPPARDVAGMLRALDHVGRIVDRRTGYASCAEVRAWTAGVRERFLTSYRAGLAATGHEGVFDERLLPAFEVEQECRELVYAARHLPRWTYVPDAALGDLLRAPTGDGHPEGGR